MNKELLIQHTLSCIAKNFSLYVIANLGAKEKCRQSDSNCPQSGYYQFNANVVYSPSGVHIERYYKKNLQEYEKWYDIPSFSRISYFKTPYGTIGTLVSYDIFNRELSIDLIENHKIDIIALSSAWINKTPFFAIPFHSSWASILGVTLLVSNLKIADEGIFGSGIYLHNDILMHSLNSHKDELLIADLEIPLKKGNISYFPFINLPRLFIREANLIFKAYFHSVNYTMTLFKGETNEAKAEICQNRFCCIGEVRNKDGNLPNFALGIYKENFKDSQYPSESCLVIRWRNNNVLSSVRTRIVIMANFTAKYVFPVYHYIGKPFRKSEPKYTKIPFRLYGLYPYQFYSFDDNYYETVGLYGKIYEDTKTTEKNLVKYRKVSYNFAKILCPNNLCIFLSTIQVFIIIPIKIKDFIA